MEKSVLAELSTKSGYSLEFVSEIITSYVAEKKLNINDKKSWKLSNIADILRCLNLKNNFKNFNLISRL